MFMASACARQPVTVPPADGAGRWQAFVARSEAIKEAPYLLNASLRFGTEGDTRRVTALLWGNDSRSLRMDVMAGIGAVVAKIWESGDEFLVYSPTENRAFFSIRAATSPCCASACRCPLPWIGWRPCSTAAS